MGQFLTVDPLVDATGQAYAYTGDDPVNETDPSGDWLFGLGGSDCLFGQNPNGGCWGSSRAAQGLKGAANRGAGLGNAVTTIATLGNVHVSAPFCGPGLGFSYQDGNWSLAIITLGPGVTSIQEAMLHPKDRSPHPISRRQPTLNICSPTDLPPGWTVLMMPPTSDYADGYWVETNAGGQPIDPSTGKPPSNVTRGSGVGDDPCPAASRVLERMICTVL